MVRFSPLSYNTAGSPSEAGHLLWESQGDKRAKPFGRTPDPTRPLRTCPVRRDEVLIGRRWRLLAMPIGTWTSETRPWFTGHDGRQHTQEFIVGNPTLWQPFLDGLTAEIAEAAQRRVLTLREHPDFAQFMAPPPQLPKPEFSASAVREYVCEHCGRRYLRLKLRGNERVCICSNHCERARQKARQRQWREDHPARLQGYHRRLNALRAERRADARASRVCEHCGAPIEAARATKRYCSGICRMRAHRERAAADQRSDPAPGRGARGAPCGPSRARPC